MIVLCEIAGAVIPANNDKGRAERGPSVVILGKAKSLDSCLRRNDDK